MIQKGANSMRKLHLFVSAISIATATAALGAAQANDAAPAAGIELLPATAKPVSYSIAVTPDIEARTFAGEAKLVFDVLKATDTIVVNAIDLDIASAVLDGATPAAVSVDNDAQTATFVFPKAVRKGRHTIDVKYAGKIYDQSFGLFASAYPDPAGEKTAIYTQFEPGDARRLAPMWDEPAQKAVFNMSVTAPAGQKAFSNMPVIQETGAGGGAVRYDFAPTPKMSSYLLFIGAGEFDRLAGESEGVELGIVTRAGASEKGQYALDATKEILPYFNSYFGVKYPLPKLDQLAAPGAGGFSAMENWGAIFYFEPVLLFDPATDTPASKQTIFGVTAHEIAHQWFGNLVTMQWWGDLWLNEGFASWMASKVTSSLRPEWSGELRAANTKDYAMATDSVSSTHPIVMPVRNVDEATVYFDAISYLKGQSIINMIESYLGEDAFKAGIQAYMAKHAYGNAITDDLWSALEKASKQPVLAIAHSFTLQPGVPLITVENVICKNGASSVTVRQSRFGADAASKAAQQEWTVPVTLSVAGSGETARAIVKGGQAQTITAPGCGAVKLNAGESGYYRTLYSDAAFSALAGGYAALDDIDKLGLTNDAYALATAGDAPFARFMTLVEQTTAGADPILVGNIASDLVELRRYYRGEQGFDAFSAYALNWLKPAFAAVTWNKTEGEPDNVTNLRNSLLAGLAYYGDEAVVKEARKRYAAYKKDPSSLPPEQVRRVIGIVAAKADAKTFDELLAKGLAAKNPNEQRIYLNALANIEDEALARRAVDIFLSDKTPAQFRARLFASLAGEHPRMIWDYYRNNFERIDALLDPLGRYGFGPQIASESDDAVVADELRAFADANLPAEAEQSVKNAIARIRFSAEVKEKRIPELTKWIEEHS